MDGVFQIIFTLLFAYISFRVSEIATLSGVITIFTYGIVAKHYLVCELWFRVVTDIQFWNMVEGARDTVSMVFRYNFNISILLKKYFNFC